MTWAIVWPRPLPASIETLLAHRWAFWAAAEALAEDGYRLLALDAVVCEIRGRLATARATKGASRKPGPPERRRARRRRSLAPRAHRSNVPRGTSFFPTPVKRPRNLGFLGLFATGAPRRGAPRRGGNGAKGVWGERGDGRGLGAAARRGLPPTASRTGSRASPRIGRSPSLANRRLPNGKASYPDRPAGRHVRCCRRLPQAQNWRRASRRGAHASRTR